MTGEGGRRAPVVGPTVRALLCVLVVLTALLLVPLALAGERPGEPAPAALAAWTRWPAGLTTALPAEEQADRLATDVRLESDGSAVVTETIRWRFPDGEERHGILRNVKVRAGYQDSRDPVPLLRAHRGHRHLPRRVRRPTSRSPTSAPSGRSGSAARRRPSAARPTTSCATGSPTSSTTSATAPRSSTTTSSTPPTASPARRLRHWDRAGPGDLVACFYGEPRLYTLCEANAGLTRPSPCPTSRPSRGERPRRLISARPSRPDA